MTTQLRTDRGSELWILSRGLLQMKLKNLKLRHRLKLRSVDLNPLADELAEAFGQLQADGKQIIDFPRSLEFPAALQLILDPSAQKRRN